MSARDGVVPMRYVAGFAFDGERVLLIRKTRPAWQAGLLNGVGGKIESGESPAEAMRREAIEEVGLDATWEHFATLSGGGFEVVFFRTEALTIKGPSANDVGEGVEVHPSADIPRLSTIPNLRWLVPMAHESNRHDWPFRVFEREAPEEPVGYVVMILDSNGRAVVIQDPTDSMWAHHVARRHNGTVHPVGPALPAAPATEEGA